MKVAKGFCIREILDEIVAIPTNEAASLFSGIISLNETGRFLFEELSNEHTIESLTNSLLDHYDIDYQTAQADVVEFLDLLRKNNLLVE